MLKILLVDDEILVRVGIKSIINWEEYGYIISGEASSGKDALEKIKADQPHIILTDLVMEPGNGFELITTVTREYPSIKIIVLSCYNDFESVKEAMKLGASDYIFKLTIKPEELLKTLNGVRQQLEEKLFNDMSEKQNDRILWKNIAAIKSSVIKAAIEKSYVSGDECRRELKELGVQVDFSSLYAVMVISIDEFYLLNLNSVIKERELLKFSMLNIINEVMEKMQAEVFDYDAGTVLAVINSNYKSGEGDLLKDIQGMFDNLFEYIKRYLGVAVSAGISRLHSNMDELSVSYQEALTALGMRFFKGRGQLNVFDDTSGIVELDNQNISIPQEVSLQSFYDIVDHLEEGRILDFINKYFDFIESRRYTSSSKIRSLLLELFYPFINAAKKRGFDPDIIKTECGFTPYQVITQYDSIHDIKIWFMKFVELFISECRKRNDSRSREEIILIKDFVRKNIDREIGISEAARYVNMSESYFSHLFKKETGVSFVDFVNAQKIERSKELILQTDLKIYEVAAKVGFDNANYFSMLFKKITGQSPNEYRK